MTRGGFVHKKRVEIRHWLNLHKISWKPNTSNCRPAIRV